MKEKEIGLISAAAFAFGTFLPILNTPFGSVNFYSNSNSSWEGIIFVALAICFAFVLHRGDSKKAKIISAICGVLAVIDFFLNFFRINSIKKEALTELQGNPFAGLAETMINNIGLSWGWLVIIIGVIGMIYVCYKDEINRIANKSQNKEEEKKKK